MSELSFQPPVKQKPSTPKAAKPATDSIWQRDIALKPAFGLKEKKAFYQLLATLRKSGLPLLEALEVLAENQKKKAVRQIYQRIIDQLQDGQSLSDSLAAQGKHFSIFEISSIRMGESTGKLVNILRELSQYYESRLKLRRKLTQVMSYPLVVISLAVGVLYFMLAQVVPMFEDVFDQFDAELPWLTQRILSISTFLSEQGGWIFLGIAVLIGTMYLLRSRTWFQQLSTQLLLRIPLIGGLLLKVQLARLAVTLGTLLQAKVNLDQALILTEEIIRFYPLRKTLPIIRMKVVAGESLYDSIQGFSIYPLLWKQMVKVGERTASLDELLLNLGHTLDEESETAIGNLTNVLEPLLVILLGVIVGVILVAMYLPMFQLSQSIGV